MSAKDWFLFSGVISQVEGLIFAKCVDENKKEECAVIVMCSNGGSPDAAYKMAKHLQHVYDSYSVVVAGYCKSAATLFAIGADELIFTPFGELGPLDVQFQKEDKLFGQESGLNITEAIINLENHALQMYYNMVPDIIARSGGVVTFRTASEVATGVISALYGPIFGQIDPEKVGERMRAMRIGKEYAARLDFHENLKLEALDLLTKSYASHSFVIDYKEAELLFKKVRLVTDEEKDVILSLGSECQYPSKPAIIEVIDVQKSQKTNKEKEKNNATGNNEKS